jgi:hypothetical protein
MEYRCCESKNVVLLVGLDGVVGSRRTVTDMGEKDEQVLESEMGGEEIERSH